MSTDRRDLRYFRQMFPDRDVREVIRDIGGGIQVLCADGSSVLINREGQGER